MSKLWKAFGLGGGKELNYDIGEPIAIAEEYRYRINFSLNKGYSKTDKSEATVFSFEIKPNSSADVVELCRNCVKRMRTIMLPNVLKYLDGMETPTGIYIVTEPVVPLRTYLDNMTEDDQETLHEFTSWGLYSVIKALEHLHSGNFVHGNFGMHSIYVNKCGDWKLFGLDWCSQLAAPDINGEVRVNHFKQYNHLIPNEMKAPELIGAPKWPLVEASPVWSTDAWALGLLFFETFNHQITSSTSPQELRNPGNMPRALFGAYMKLATNSPKNRMNPADLLQDDYFASNEYIQVQQQLENMAFMLKDNLEMEQFLRKLERMVTSFPKANCKYKILPKISEATQFGTGGTAALTTILKLADSLTEDEFTALVIPGLLALYNSRDPNVRVQLLQTIPLYVRHFKEPTTTTIWNLVAQGFASNYAEIRELSVKCLIHFVPYLPERIISGDVMKQLWQMQTDKEGGIRTNAIICLGKLAPLLTHSVREKMLLPSFSRSLKDPFHHSRIACCQSFAATAEYYSDQQMAAGILPVVAPLTADPVKDVRTAAFRCIGVLLGRLQKMSDGLLDPHPVQETATTVHQQESGSYLGWAVSSLKTKIYGETETGAADKSAGATATPPRPPKQAAAKPSGATSTPAGGSSSSAAAATSSYSGEGQYNEQYDQEYYGQEYGEYGAEGYYDEQQQWTEHDQEEATTSQADAGWNQDLSDFDEDAAKPTTAKSSKATKPTKKVKGDDDDDGWNQNIDDDEDDWDKNTPPRNTTTAQPSKSSPVSGSAVTPLGSTASGTEGSSSKSPMSSSVTRAGSKSSGGMELKKPVKRSLGAKKVAAD